MAYNITLTNGQNLVTIEDGTADSSYSSLTLFGKNFAGYGPLLNENAVHQLENFSFNSPPVSPLQGQLWWDSANKLMKVFNSSTWKVISGPTSATTAPGSTITGDLWWDNSNQQLNIFNGNDWSLVGPAFNATQGLSGQVVSTVLDNFALPHTVIVDYVAGVAVSITSKDPAFSSTTIPGFTTIKPGYNIVTSAQYHGDADNALKLGGIAAGNFLRSDVVSTTNFALNVLSNTGVTVGLNSDLTINVANNSVNLLSNTLGRDLCLYTSVEGVSTQGLKLSGTTGKVTVNGDPTVALGVATKNYVDTSLSNASTTWLLANGSAPVTGSLIPNLTGSYNLGSSANRYGTVYANTFNGINAYVQGADLAEYYTANENYEPGTVLDFGGSAEVCKSIADMSTRVAGVVSTKPGYLMNQSCVSEFVTAIALQGRVPCKVTGKIYPGALLVSAGNGTARAEENPKPGSIIGKAIGSFDGVEGVIEVAVGRF